MQLGAPAIVTIAIEKSLNQLISQARNDISKQAAELAGKVIGIKLNELPWPLYFGFYQQVDVMGQYDKKADVFVQLSLKDLSQLQQANVLTELIKSDKMVLDGDLQTLQAFGALVNHLDIDWFEPLSPYLSDNLLGLVEQGAHKVKQKLQGLHQDAVEHATDILQEEYRILPRSAELTLLKQELAELELKTNKISQLIQTLKP